MHPVKSKYSFDWIVTIVHFLKIHEQAVLSHSKFYIFSLNLYFYYISSVEFCPNVKFLILKSILLIMLS